MNPRREFNKVGHPRLPEKPSLQEIALWLRDKAIWEELQPNGREPNSRAWAKACLICAAEDIEQKIAGNVTSESEGAPNAGVSGPVPSGAQPSAGDGLFCSWEHHVEEVRELEERLRNLGKELALRREKLSDVVPETYGDAVIAHWIPLDGVENYEWDNRTTEENAVWLLERLRRRQPSALLCEASGLTQERDSLREQLNSVAVAPTEADKLRELLTAVSSSGRNLIRAANKLRDDADSARYKNKSLMDGIKEISGDFIPDSRDTAPLALDEMRNALLALLDEAS